MHVHISALNALIAFLYALIGLGTARLLALSHPDSKLAQGWLALY